MISFVRPKSTSFVGLSFHFDEIRLVQQRRFKKQSVIENFAIQPIAPGVIRDGLIVEKDAFVDALQSLVQTLQIKNVDTAIALPASLVVQKRVTLMAGLTQEEYRAEISANLSHYFPNFQDEIVFDFQIMKKKTQGEEIILVAARAEQVKSYSALVERAGLRVRVIDMDCYALVRPILHVQAISETCLVIDLDSHAAQCVLLQGDEIVLTHKIMVDSKDASFAQRVVEHMKRMFLLANHDCTTWPFKKILVSGNCKLAYALKNYLEDNFSLHIELINPFRYMPLSPTLHKETLYSVAPAMIAAVGLSMRDRNP